MKYTSLGCVIAAGILAGGLHVSSAKAADLGGDCCADLEERIAELEATTVRKGNRQVSVKISGWVAKELMIWDDGDLSDAYVVGPSTTLGTHFKISGEGQIKPGWSAGFDVHIEVLSSESLFVDQFDDDAGGNRVNPLLTYLYIKSDQLGKLSIGKLSQASDNAAILADFSGSLVQANWVLFDGASFFLRPEGSGLSGHDGLSGNRIGSLGYCGQTGLGIGADCNGVPTDAIRYDSPTIAGFSASASWGEDDFWDVAARYAGEWNSIKLKVEGAYAWNGDRDDGVDSEYFQIGAMIMHTPTGLFLYGAYGEEDISGLYIDVGDDNLQEVDDNDHWYVKGGVRRQWFSLGHTVLYGEYGQYNDMYGGFSCSATLDGPNNTIGKECRDDDGIAVTGSQIERWGLGIVQEIDSAAMSIWAKYVNLDPEIDYIELDTEDHRTQDYEEFHTFLVGAMINF